MEGMPRVPMITPEMKIPELQLPPDLIPKLREYILVHYNDDPTRFNDAFSELQAMRYHISRCSADVESICVLKRYYSQLRMMKSRFPMEPGDPCAVAFNWSDRSYDLASGTTFDDVNFELINVMYNIGVYHATIAVNETRSDMNSIKNSFSHFQCAAGAFQDLLHNNHVDRYGLFSFEKCFLEFFLSILLAQAQECLIEKAIIDKRMNTAIAKLACYASETYYELFAKLENQSFAELLPSAQRKSWKNLCGSKGHLYAAISRMHLGQHADDEKKYGEKLAHYAAALSHINDAAKIVEKDKRESLKQAVGFVQDIIVKREQTARKDNEFIYRERIPLAEELTQVEARTMVNAISFDPCDRSISGDDLFAALLPANVLKGVSEYMEEKTNLKRKIKERIERRDDELDQYLWSLNFSELNLDQPETDVQLPQELLDASAAFTTVPHAFSDLVSKLNDIADKSRTTDGELNELSRRLLGVKCPKLEEDEGYQTIVARVHELKEHHVKARANNIELHKALADQSEQLKTLALPFHELAKHICSKVVTSSGTPEGIMLRKMIDKVDEMRRQRAALFMSFETDIENDDITAKVLADKNLHMSELFEDELHKHDKSIKLIEMNLVAQDNILGKLTEANANFAELRQSIVENNETRKKQSGKLIAAYEVFVGVRERTDAAETFFNQLFSLIRDIGKATSIMEETFAGERQRHEEQQKLVIERAIAYRERVAMENANPEVVSTGERRRPKLADYMAYYRSKLAPGAQGQMPPPSSAGFQRYGNASDISGPSPTMGRSSANSLESVNGPGLSSMANGMNPVNEQVPATEQGQFPPMPNPQQYPGVGGRSQQVYPQHLMRQYSSPQQWQQPQQGYQPLISHEQHVPRPSMPLQSQPSYPGHVAPPPTSLSQPSGHLSTVSHATIPQTPASLVSEPASGQQTPSMRSETSTPVMLQQSQPYSNAFPSQHVPQIPNQQQLQFGHPLQQTQQFRQPPWQPPPSQQVTQHVAKNDFIKQQLPNGFNYQQLTQNQQSNTPTVPQGLPSVPMQQPQQFQNNSIPVPQQFPGLHSVGGAALQNGNNPNPQQLNGFSSQQQFLPSQQTPKTESPQNVNLQGSVVHPPSTQPLILSTASQLPLSALSIDPNKTATRTPLMQPKDSQMQQLAQQGPAAQHVSQSSISAIPGLSSNVLPPQQVSSNSVLQTASQQPRHIQIYNVPQDHQQLGNKVQPTLFVHPSNNGAVSSTPSGAAQNGFTAVQNITPYSKPQPQNWMPQQLPVSHAPPKETFAPVNQQPKSNPIPQQQWQSQPIGAVSAQTHVQQPSQKIEQISSNQQAPIGVQPVPPSVGIAPSPYANMFNRQNGNVANVAASPWHRNMPPSSSSSTPAPTNNVYISPFAASRLQNDVQQSVAPSPFRPIVPANGSIQNGNHVLPQRDITSDLLDNLFAPNRVPLQFSRQNENNVGAVDPSPQAMMCRSAATVLPMRRPDGTWSTGADDNNAILSFTNVQSVSVSEDGTERPVNGVGPL